ncbi:MAG: SDR family oxidoreductase [Blastocatellia bacterium]|nr:SDR family oxidoreductase [Blastocatellia bacterium]
MPDKTVVLLTGCASGIGQRLAGFCYAAGYQVILTDLRIEELRQQVAANQWDPEQLLVCGLDVRSAADWQTVIQTTLDRWGRIDVLLNVAGFISPGFLTDLDVADIDRHLDINAKGVILGTKLVGDVMVRQKAGHILNIASLAGLAPVPGLSLYSASKFAVRGFSLAVASELKKHGVFLTVICPDAVMTPMLEKQFHADAASLTFSGGKVLTVNEVEQAVEAALRTKPLEITLPFSRGLLAKLAGSFPQISGLLENLLFAKGRKKRQALAEHHQSLEKL